MSYTLGQAARATGKSKPTIQRAIKNGLVSANKTENGSYLIDPAELHRVFPVVLPDTGNDTGDMKQSVPPDLPGETQALRLLLEQVKSERDDLRRRLDDEADERRRSADEVRRLTLLLMPPPKESPAAEEPRPASSKGSDERLGLLWSALTVLVWAVLLGAVAFGLSVWWPSLNQQ